MKQPARYCVRLFTILTLSALAWAKSNPERTQFNRDIRIEPDEKVGDATCLNCNVYVRGQVTGDVSAACQINDALPVLNKWSLKTSPTSKDGQDIATAHERSTAGG